MRASSVAAVRLVPLLVGSTACLAVGGLFAGTLRAAPAECRFTEEPPRIDGRLDDAAWGAATVVDAFVPPAWLAEAGGIVPQGTRARLLWDREYLYVGADMDDADLAAHAADHGGDTSNDDAVAVLLKPSAAKPAAYEFRVTAANVAVQRFMSERGRREPMPGEGAVAVESAVAVRGSLDSAADRDEGWSLELRIPWTSLVRTGGRPEPDDAWLFAIGRIDGSSARDRADLSSSVRLTDAGHGLHGHEDYASLPFSGPGRTPGARPPGIPRIDVVRGCTVSGSPEPPLPYTVKRVLPLAAVTCPIMVAHQPGSDRLLYATEPWGYAPSKVMRIRDDAESFEPELVLPDQGTVHYGIEFHPDFLENGYFYVGSNGPAKRGDATDKDIKEPVMSRITRYRMDPRPPYAVDPSSAEVVIEWDSDGHNGAVMAFGPDGMLYVTSGDGSKDSDVDLAGQDLSRLRSKLLRIDVDHPDEDTPGDGRSYSVPQDNPFVGMEGVRPETWAYGLRNPWRIAIDRETGQIWVGNNGQDLWEQVYLVERGANYGWSIMEGSHPFAPGRKAGPHPFSRPVAEHSHAEARSLTGGIVYRGSALPELRGAYIYGDYATGKIWGIRHDGTKVIWHRLLADTTLQISGFGTDSKGEILICDHQGRGRGGFHTLVPMPEADAGRPPFPRRLSASGLFTSLREHVPAPGVIPYDVNAPSWNDGARAVRFLALPPAADGDGPASIEVTNAASWNFPDGTVVVQSLAIEEEEGTPESRRWVETRLMLKEAGEWVGYTYEWNDEQTDAELVPAGGKERDFAIRTADLAAHPDGVRNQTWRFASRTECMVCHSRQCGFVLGLSTVQLNRDFDYAAILGPGHATDNQLRSFEHLGLLAVNWWADARAAYAARAAVLVPDGALPTVAETEAARVEWTDRQLASGDPDAGQFSARRSPLLFRAPGSSNRLVDPADSMLDLEARARSYLQVNCACCHVIAGGGNAQIDLTSYTAYDTLPLAAMKLVDGAPIHQTFGIPDARLVAPGHPERSVLLARVSRRGPGQMPQIGTTLVDRSAVDLLTRWIESLPGPARAVANARIEPAR